MGFDYPTGVDDPTRPFDDFYGYSFVDMEACLENGNTIIDLRDNLRSQRGILPLDARLDYLFEQYVNLAR